MTQLVQEGTCVHFSNVLVNFHRYRQLLELQKLRRKAKKVVDTKASKGRKIRSVTGSVNNLPSWSVSSLTMQLGNQGTWENQRIYHMV